MCLDDLIDEIIEELFETKNSYTFDKHIEIFIPSTQDVTQKISPEEFNQRITCVSPSEPT